VGQVETNVGKRAIHLLKGQFAFNSLENIRHHDNTAAVVLNLRGTTLEKVSVPGRSPIRTTVGRTDARNSVYFHVRDEYLAHLATHAPASS
jgi:hypothetical protein